MNKKIFIFAGLLLASGAFFAGKVSARPTIIEGISAAVKVVKPTVTPTPTSTPVPTSVPTQIPFSPTTQPSPTPNTDIQDQINQIDQQIASLQQQQQSAASVIRAGVNCITSTCVSTSTSEYLFTVSLNNQIKILQNEKTDLELQLK